MRYLILTFGTSILLLFLCNEKSFDWKSDISFSYRSSKCITDANDENVFADSSFVYSFTDSLVIDFLVRANCCPDSNRFLTTFDKSIVDTLFISVTDTAQNLCYCTCRYMIHAVFQNLPGNHYVVRCKLNNYKGTFDPIYLVDVYRKE